MIGVGLAVCVPPSPVFTSLTITVRGDNSSAGNCQIEPCLNDNCTCRNIFDYAACGIFSIPLTVYIQNHNESGFAHNYQYAAWWLSTLGLASVQTFVKDLSINIDTYCVYSECFGAHQWAINIFPQLEVVWGTLNFHFNGIWNSNSFALLPGSGFAKLRATGRTNFTASNGIWANADLSFLSSLVCPGTQIDGTALSALRSLTGLDQVVDGNPAMVNQTCFFSFTNSESVLLNVTAIARFAGCGGRQRPDNSTSLPCLNVWCGQIDTWTDLCNYVANGNLCS
jgi:hypothetical protein